MRVRAFIALTFFVVVRCGVPHKIQVQCVSNHGKIHGNRQRKMNKMEFLGANQFEVLQSIQSQIYMCVYIYMYIYIYINILVYRATQGLNFILFLCSNYFFSRWCFLSRADGFSWRPATIPLFTAPAVTQAIQAKKIKEKYPPPTNNHE